MKIIDCDYNISAGVSSISLYHRIDILRNVRSRNYCKERFISEKCEINMARDFLFFGTS